MSENWLIYKNYSDSKKADRHQFLISIPKKIVPLATDRNRLRRLIREAYRQSKFPVNIGFVSYFRVSRFPGQIKLDSVLDQLKRQRLS